MRMLNKLYFDYFQIIKLKVGADKQVLSLSHT